MATATKQRVDLGAFEFDKLTTNFVRYVNGIGTTQYVAKSALGGIVPDSVRVTLEF